MKKMIHSKIAAILVFNHVADFNHFSPVNKSVIMETTLITVHCKLFQIMPYVIILEVRKFHQPTTVLSKQGNNHLNRVKSLSGKQ